MLGGILAYLVRQKGEWLAHFPTQRAAGGLLLIGVSVFCAQSGIRLSGLLALLPTVGAFPGDLGRLHQLDQQIPPRAIA